MTADLLPKFVLLITSDGSEITGNTLSEIVDQLIPEHATLPEDEDGAKDRLILRHDFLVLLGKDAQAVAAASTAAENPEAFSQLDEDELTILFHDRGSERVEFPAWNADVPLFLLATSYAPFTETERPEGENIWWLDPSTERTFLDSLKVAGAAELLTRDDTDAEIDAAFA